MKIKRNGKRYHLVITEEQLGCTQCAFYSSLPVGCP